MTIYKSFFVPGLRFCVRNRGVNGLRFLGLRTEHVANRRLVVDAVDSTAAHDRLDDFVAKAVLGVRVEVAGAAFVAGNGAAVDAAGRANTFPAFLAREEMLEFERALFRALDPNATGVGQIVKVPDAGAEGLYLALCNGMSGYRKGRVNNDYVLRSASAASTSSASVSGLGWTISISSSSSSRFLRLSVFKQ